ncbi:response regulator transcription factor [Cohnella lupini]|uniref:YesN/AraC family two-component response regulator n=1 Tax=Cohnella lupini TaxID=1294267 RepID=A0A3D9IJA8_9BACL|nr:response regulator [Cohnella lupini]RED61832.1 YesN/AraC family two-component response regulator [Cohnella lupini]
MKLVKSLKIIVIEDEPVILENIIKKIKGSQAEFTVVAKAYNGKNGLALIKAHKPDAIITDIKMPIMDGIELISQVRLLFPEMPVIVLSGYDEFEYARQAMRFGVMDYLLKPLDTAMLLDALNRVRNVVYPKNDLIERNIISSELLGQNQVRELATLTNDARYQIVLICLGNLCNHVTSINRAYFFADLWGQIDWEQTIEQLPSKSQSWWLIDEKLSNQKFLILSAAENNEISDIQSTAEWLQASLLAAVAPYAVNISVHAEITPNHELWKVAQELRSRLERNMLLGKSSIHFSSSEIKSKREDSSGGVSPSAYNRISSLLETDNTELLRPALFKLFESWETAGYSQRQIEKTFGDLIDLFRRSKILIGKDEWDDIEAQILDSISLSVDYATLCTKVWSLLERTLIPKNIIEETAELSDKIEQYLQDHYAEDISFEELAHKFNFTSAYLTKIFKKHKNETPLKYLTSLRMEEAKRLIVEHKELDLRIIAEMIGYFDPHYFSKVFKSNVGKTPTEYRTDPI